MADGGGRGHFSTLAEIRTALADHERRLRLVERDVIDLTDEVAGGKRPRRRRPRGGSDETVSPKKAKP